MQNSNATASKLSKWDLRFLRLAEHVAQWSKDPSTKVGAVITDGGKHVISMGYNGFPVGDSDDPALYADRAYKYKYIIHGEINAFENARRTLFDGCTLYTVPFMPCSVCADIIIAKGIKRVVAPYSDNPRWIESFKVTERKFAENGVILELEYPKG